MTAVIVDLAAVRASRQHDADRKIIESLASTLGARRLTPPEAQMFLASLRTMDHFARFAATMCTTGMGPETARQWLATHRLIETPPRMERAEKIREATKCAGCGKPVGVRETAAWDRKTNRFWHEACAQSDDGES